jgi:hypothetical protein
MQAEIEPAKIRAALDKTIALLDAHLNTPHHEQKLEYARKQYPKDVAEVTLARVASAARDDMNTRQTNDEEEINVRREYPGEGGRAGGSSRSADRR